MLEPEPMAMFADTSREPPFPITPIKLWVWRSPEVELRCATYPAPTAYAMNGYVQLPPLSMDRVTADLYNMWEHESPDRRDRRLLSGDWNVGYDALRDVPCPGGLTYGPDAQDWIGFDTGHAWDSWGTDEDFRKIFFDSGNPQLWEKFLQSRQLMGDLWPPNRGLTGPNDPWSTLWTVGRLEEQVNALAKRVADRLIGARLLMEIGS